MAAKLSIKSLQQKYKKDFVLAPDTDIRTYPIVIVHWHDTVSVSKWRFPPKEWEAQSTLCASVGFIMSCNDLELGICLSVNSIGHVGDSMHIPIGCIEAVYAVKNTYKAVSRK